MYVFIMYLFKGSQLFKVSKLCNSNLKTQKIKKDNETRKEQKKQFKKLFFNPFQRTNIMLFKLYDVLAKNE